MSDATHSSRPRACIDLGALRANVARARALARGRECIAVVKADGYGHGVLPVAREALAGGASRLAVVTVDEAAELRAGAIACPLLVLGGARSPAEARALAEARAAAVVHHEDGVAWLVEAARRAGRRVPVQVEVDTGMHRMGVPAAEAAAFCARVAAHPSLALQGVFTHFACADDPDPTSALAQCARLREVLGELAVRGVATGEVHAANSAGLLSPALLDALPEATAVRPGLMLYGVSPAAHLGDAGLRPVMSLRAPVVRIHDVPRGEAVGYAASWRAPRATRVATLALGYADGVAWTAGSASCDGRARESGAHVWLGGAACPVVGRISMDSMSVDVGPADALARAPGGGAPVELGDEAILFGPDDEGAVPIRVEDAARSAGTLHYELLVRVGRRVAREYTGASV
ncbi:MAG: alanine racemase [Myxococcales bacterium]|nr:alanine racemase [Myxococcales bacterium]